MPKIIVKDAYKKFGSKVVLDGVNLELEDGESLVVIGGSGSGKSVLLKSILGLIPLDSGEILIDGEIVAAKAGRKRDEMLAKFGMLFQGGALFDSLLVWQNISFVGLQNKGLSKKEAKELAIKRLRSVGLGAGVADLSPSELSGGMQKRVALARAIAFDPEIIFFDEPTTGLDPIMADVINELIVKCSKELNSTTLTITHDMHSARKIANRVAMIYQGKIIWQGKSDMVMDSGNEFVDQFVHGKAQGPIQAIL